MHKLQPKQVNKIFGVKHFPEKFASGTTNFATVTSMMTDCFTAYGVTDKLSSGPTDIGVDGTYCRLMYASNNAPLQTLNGEEVYATLQKEISNAWTVFYHYVSKDDGLVYDYSFVNDTEVILQYIYRAQLAKVWNDINSFDRIQNTRKKYIDVANVQTISIPYEVEYFGWLPCVQAIDKTGNSITGFPWSLDDINNPTQIDVDFGVPVDAWIIIS